jgi:hypothetical protein
MQIGRELDCLLYLEGLVHRYATRLTPEKLAVTGGDQPVAAPLFAVPDESEEP